ncbi:MAG: Arylsulfatase [Frankiales bacterium]|nr:Arylsulfatase [Frankiales bacterium]
MDEPFQGVIGRLAENSTAWWPPTPQAPAGAPNVVLVVLDDVGFAQLGCYGSRIETPVLDGLAEAGLQFTGFHTTALCSPTRSCLLTGRNHHANGMGRVAELAAGFPGYDSRIPRANAMLPAVLTGFSSWAVGKWHLAPEEDVHAAASRGRWPLGRGFERFYGFMGGETHQYSPNLVRDNGFTEQPYTEGYHLTEDLVDESIRLVADHRQADADKPFFLYLATGACHSPHQVPAEWVRRHEGRFDDGWDVVREETLARQKERGLLPESTVLSPLPEWVRPWASIKPEYQRLFARQMEVFAGYLSHTDHHIGRLLEFLRETGDLDNTIVLVLSDNGASSEGGSFGSVNDNRAWNLSPSSIKENVARIDELGGPTVHNNYPWGWTVAGNTPFRRWKREVHEGGVADPLIVHWPAGITKPGLRHQYVHAIDVLPTVLEAAGIAMPDVVDGVPQRPVDGVSFLGAITADEPSLRHVQYYEMFGCRAIWRDGWKAVAWHPIAAAEPGLDNVQWELYDTRVDPSECHDLALENQELLAELVALWWSEAERNQVLPLDNRPFSELIAGRPTGLRDRSSYTYWPGTAMVGEAAMVNVRNRTHEVRADVTLTGRGHGVLLCQGNVLGGWVLFLSEGRLRWVHSYVGLSLDRIGSEVQVPPGQHSLTMRYAKTGDHTGDVSLLIDGAVVGSGQVPAFTPSRFSLTGAGQWCGRSGTSPVCDDDGAGDPFTGGALHRVVVTVEGEPYTNAILEAERAIRSQ